VANRVPIRHRRFRQQFAVEVGTKIAVTQPLVVETDRLSQTFFSWQDAYR
jgi:hypothetical protein